MSVSQKLEDYLGKCVSAAAWLTRDDNKNGNGAHSYVSCGELELVDQGYGWEYRVVRLNKAAGTEASLAFDSCMVSAITTDDDGTPMIVVILTDG